MFASQARARARECVKFKVSYLVVCLYEIVLETIVHAHEQLGFTCLKLKLLIPFRVPQSNNVVDDTYWDAYEGHKCQDSL